jgi:hypothetical protein
MSLIQPKMLPLLALRVIFCGYIISISNMAYTRYYYTSIVTNYHYSVRSLKDSYNGRYDYLVRANRQILKDSWIVVAIFQDLN